MIGMYWFGGSGDVLEWPADVGEPLAVARVVEEGDRRYEPRYSWLSITRGINIACRQPISDSWWT